MTDMLSRTLIMIGIVAAAALAEDAIFTYDGSEYHLRENYAWECKGATCPGKEGEPVVIELSNDQTVVLDRNGQWHFKQKGEIVGTKDIKIHKADATTVGEHRRIDVADHKARNACSKKIADKVVAGAPKRKLTRKKVLYCMDNMRIVPDTKDQQVKGKGWKVTASISLDRNQILRLVECAEQVVEKDEKEEKESQEEASPTK